MNKNNIIFQNSLKESADEEFNADDQNKEISKVHNNIETNKSLKITNYKSEISFQVKEPRDDFYLYKLFLNAINSIKSDYDYDFLRPDLRILIKILQITGIEFINFDSAKSIALLESVSLLNELVYRFDFQLFQENYKLSNLIVYFFTSQQRFINDEEIRNISISTQTPVQLIKNLHDLLIVKLKLISCEKILEMSIKEVNTESKLLKISNNILKNFNELHLIPSEIVFKNIDNIFINNKDSSLGMESSTNSVNQLTNELNQYNSVTILKFFNNQINIYIEETESKICIFKNFEINALSNDSNYRDKKQKISKESRSDIEVNGLKNERYTKISSVLYNSVNISDKIDLYNKNPFNVRKIGNAVLIEHIPSLNISEHIMQYEKDQSNYFPKHERYVKKNKNDEPDVKNIEFINS